MDAEEVAREAAGSEARLLYPVEAAARRIGVGRTTLYALISNGSLQTVQIGRRRLVADADLLAFVAGLRTDQAAHAEDAQGRSRD